MDNIDGEYDRFVYDLHDSAKRAKSLKTTKRRRLSPEALQLIRQGGAARASGNWQLTPELAKLCEVLAEAAEAGLSIRNTCRNFANFKTKTTTFHVLAEPFTSSRITTGGFTIKISPFYNDVVIDVKRGDFVVGKDTRTEADLDNHNEQWISTRPKQFWKNAIRKLADRWQQGH
ncbi:unnamed protein product [Heligmosomoides polygyrus]|uniref:Transposase n=1 Tax=Heligmosomoides polygyrus TaxID=6339 RepID=A0A183FVH5_HELPZ|nr:unnamed protein product [Heligmosomoides polygyrus]